MPVCAGHPAPNVLHVPATNGQPGRSCSSQPPLPFGVNSSVRAARSKVLVAHCSYSIGCAPLLTGSDAEMSTDGGTIATPPGEQPTTAVCGTCAMPVAGWNHTVNAPVLSNCNCTVKRIVGSNDSNALTHVITSPPGTAP